MQDKFGINQLSNVLIVDEKVSRVQRLRQLLKRKGLRTFHAANEREALQLSSEEPINLVVNLSRKPLNRERFCRNLRRNPLFSGLVSQDEQEKALDEMLKVRMVDFCTNSLKQDKADLEPKDIKEELSNLVSDFNEIFKNNESFFKDMDEISQDWSRNNRDYLVYLAKESERLRDWAYERLNQIYKLELEPVLEILRQGVLPDQGQIKGVSKIEEDIQKLEPKYLSGIISLLCEINESYPVLKEETYVQNLENKRSEIEKKLARPEKLEEEEIKKLRKEMRKTAKSLYLYGH